MITISEHTIEESIINKDGYVLDLGCINFKFSEDIKKYCDNVICVDPNPNIIKIPNNIIFENKALINDEQKEEIDFFIYNDIQGYSLLNPKNDTCFLKEIIKVKTISIEKIMDKYGIKKFELIKFDIEGAEYEILENMDWSITKQISVEFHDFRSMNPYYPNNEKYYDNLLKNKAINFNVYNHKLTHHPGGAGINYWDTLFVDKQYFN